MALGLTSTPVLARNISHDHAILTEILACFLYGRTKRLSDTPVLARNISHDHAIPTETLACFLPGRTKDLSAPLY